MLIKFLEGLMNLKVLKKGIIFMNLPTKITVLRLILTIFIVLLLWLPFSSFGIQFPTYSVAGIIVDLKYIIVAKTHFFDKK